MTEAAAKALVASWEKKRYKLTPVRFVEEGGTQMGHTVVCDWKATYLKGTTYLHTKTSLRCSAVHRGYVCTWA